MVDKKKKQLKRFDTVFALGKAKVEQMKGRDNTMFQRKTEYRQEVKSE